VAAGLGVALLSRQALGLHLATGTLVTLDVEGLPIRREWHIVHLRGRRLPRAAAAFKEMLLEVARSQEPAGDRRQATGDRQQSERVVG
jgi:DNA-binding transcriptional LysR family regulator